MGYVEKLMAHGERVVLVTRAHWLALLTTIIVDVLMIIVIVAFVVAGSLVSATPLPLLGLLLLLLPLAHFGLRYVRWQNEQYVVTTRRVLEVKGTFSKYVSDSSLEMVNDVVMEQSALGRMLDYGDVKIITGSDSGTNTFTRIAHPIQLKTAMLDQKSRVGGLASAVRGEVDPSQVPELLERLDDLRRRGVVTEEEFEQEKRQLLGRLQ